ncbi:hypothetical protein CALCODRAFT_512737 [Calocera cornea HHB12733]|uniref:Protein kinase domain-containing protein n=1 Tax=Calocera cornea HHB12733 TaxID=1353952 RepID=A0A165CTX2_9BASI|nr:hypothetical protein CALCODRAFT_512737 [Calocera cornea HHB12733]
MATLTRTRTIYAGDSSALSSRSGTSSRDEHGSVHSLRSIRTLSDHGWGDDLGAPLVRMGPQLMRLPRMGYLGPLSGLGTGSYKSGTGSARSEGAYSWGMTPLEGTSERGDGMGDVDAGVDGDVEPDADAEADGEEDVVLVQPEAAELDPCSPEFASKLLSVMEGTGTAHPSRAGVGCYSCNGSDVDVDGEAEEPESPGHVGHLPDADSVDELVAKQDQFHWTDPTGRAAWVHFRPSHLDDPALLVKRLLPTAAEVRLLRMLASERMRYDPDNPVSEGLGMVVRDGRAWVCVEEKRNVEGLYLGAGCGRGMRKEWGNEKGNLMHQLLRVYSAYMHLQYLAFLHSLSITSVDLSASNILVTEHAYGNIYELLDFSTCFRFTARNSTRGPPVFDWPEGSRGAPELQCGAQRVTGEHEEEEEEGQGDAEEEEEAQANPFDVDVWALGKTLERIDYTGSNLELVVQRMLAADPAERPSAGDALALYSELVGEG